MFLHYMRSRWWLSKLPLTDTWVKMCEMCLLKHFTSLWAELQLWQKKKSTISAAGALPTHSLNVGESVAFWEVVRVSFPEHVPHAAAGKNLQASSAHPHPERKLCRNEGGRTRQTCSYLRVVSACPALSQFLPGHVHLLHFSCSTSLSSVNR